jgi:hypothetical protein
MTNCMYVVGITDEILVPFSELEYMHYSYSQSKESGDTLYYRRKGQETHDWLEVPEEFDFQSLCKSFDSYLSRKES